MRLNAFLLKGTFLWSKERFYSVKRLSGQEIYRNGTCVCVCIMEQKKVWNKFAERWVSKSPFV